VQLSIINNVSMPRSYVSTKLTDTVAVEAPNDQPTKMKPKTNLQETAFGTKHSMTIRGIVIQHSTIALDIISKGWTGPGKHYLTKSQPVHFLPHQTPPEEE